MKGNQKKQKERKKGGKNERHTQEGRNGEIKRENGKKGNQRERKGKKGVEIRDREVSFQSAMNVDFILEINNCVEFGWGRSWKRTTQETET
jgi:hypothetical protein